MFARLAKPNLRAAAAEKATSPLRGSTALGFRQVEGGTASPRKDINSKSALAHSETQGPAWNFTRIPLFPRECQCNGFQSPESGDSPSFSPAQGKLSVGAANDQLEREADSIADLVMRSTHLPSPPSPPRISRKCAACAEEKQRQPKPVGLPGSSVGEAPEIVYDVLGSSGEPLSQRSRAYFEPRFGHDFSEVRVHSDREAAESARKINAAAYTSGQRIVFGEGRYSPETGDGMKLLAHELAHVVQQHGRPSPIIARQHAGFWEKASVVWHVGALAGYRGQKIGEEALKAAQETGLQGLHNGPGDAWRHCYWNCRMTQEIGRDDASFIAENHEEQADNNPVAEHMMDSWNNQVGQDCGDPKPLVPIKEDYPDVDAMKKSAESRPTVDCDSCCQQKLDGGNLFTLENLGGGKWGGKVQSSKPAKRGGNPSGVKYEKY